MGRHCAHSTLFSQHLSEDSQRYMRQPRRELIRVVVKEIADPYLPQTSLLRALAPTTPTYVFPAMNTLMYEHPLTEQHLRVIREVIGYTVVGPIGKTLACGDVGLYHVAKLDVSSRELTCLARTWGDDRVAGHRPNSGRPLQALQGKQYQRERGGHLSLRLITCVHPLLS